MGIVYFLDVAWTWDRFALPVHALLLRPDLSVSSLQVLGAITVGIGTGQLV